MKLIKKCPKYKWNPNDACLSTKDCFQTSLWRILSNLLTPGECKCRGKLNYKCNSDYCALNEQACDSLKKIEALQNVIIKFLKSFYQD